MYWFANTIYKSDKQEVSLSIIHWLIKKLCSCEIYYSNSIDVGLYVIHGNGTVVGSRNIIGKGFRIYQCCTIGHKQVGGKGYIIGNDVTIFPGSVVVGELVIGNNVTIGANTFIDKSIA